MFTFGEVNAAAEDVLGDKLAGIEVIAVCLFVVEVEIEVWVGKVVVTISEVFTEQSTSEGQ